MIWRLHATTPGALTGGTLVELKEASRGRKNQLSFVRLSGLRFQIADEYTAMHKKTFTL